MIQNHYKKTNNRFIIHGANKYTKHC